MIPEFFSGPVTAELCLLAMLLAAAFMAVRHAALVRSVSTLELMLDRPASGPRNPTPGGGRLANLQAKLAALRYRLDSAEWELAERNGNASSQPPRQTSPGIFGTSVDALATDAAEDKVEDAVQSLLRELRGMFKSDAAALIFRKQHGGELGACKVFLEGIRGERFRQILLHEFSEATRGSQHHSFGLGDGLQHDSVLGGFSLFGFRYFSFVSLGTSSLWGDRPPFQGALWLGYSASQRPHGGDLVRLETIAARFANRLEATQRVHELRSQVSQVRDADNEKSTFLAQMSHDIRSPLNNIRAILTVFRLENSKTPDEKLVQVALQNCDTLTEMVEGILDYSRHRAGKLGAEVSVFSVVNCIHEVLTSYEVAARLKGLELKFPHDRDCFVRADRRHTKRILGNLISNAVKYTERGEISVTVDERGSDVGIAIRDSGAGISGAQLDKLFTPFHRIRTEDGNGASIEGVGLGLAISKILAEVNHGALSVESQIGIGSSFLLSLPSASEGEHRESQVDRDSARSLRLRHPLVVIADPDRDHAETVCRLLVQREIPSLAVFSVRDAIKTIELERPEIVIVDGAMEEEGAAQIVEAARSSDVAPCVLFIADAVQSISHAWPQVDRVLQKPLEQQNLVEIVERELRGREEEALAKVA